eukprot:1756708-Rhodomonas_salina.1
MIGGLRCGRVALRVWIGKKGVESDLHVLARARLVFASGVQEDDGMDRLPKNEDGYLLAPFLPCSPGSLSPSLPPSLPSTLTTAHGNDRTKYVAI